MFRWVSEKMIPLEEQFRKTSCGWKRHSEKIVQLPEVRFLNTILQQEDFLQEILWEHSALFMARALTTDSTQKFPHPIIMCTTTKWSQPTGGISLRADQTNFDRTACHIIPKPRLATTSSLSIRRPCRRHSMISCNRWKSWARLDASSAPVTPPGITTIGAAAGGRTTWGARHEMAVIGTEGSATCYAGYTLGNVYGSRATLATL